MPFDEYEKMLIEYSSVAKTIPEHLRAKYSAEYGFLENGSADFKLIGPKARGDEVLYAIHFDYDIEKEERYQGYLNRAVYLLLVAAIEFKRKWYDSKVNEEVAEDGRPRIELACGLHCGRISENISSNDDALGGYHLGLGKRSETISRLGRYCHIVASSESYEALMAYVQPGYSLKQKLFFEPLPFADNMLKGISSSHAFHELKFFTRLWHEQVGELDISADDDKSLEDSEFPKKDILRPFRENFWKYNIDSELLMLKYYDLSKDKSRNVERSNDIALEGLALAEKELPSSPVKEKVYSDMAFWYMKLGYHEDSIECGKMALEYNREYDIVYQIMVSALRKLKGPELESSEESDRDKFKEWACRAVRISPNSPSNHFQAALAYEYSREDLPNGRKHICNRKIIHHLQITNQLDSDYFKRVNMYNKYGINYRADID